MDCYLGQIMLCSFDFPPRGWALCNGQFLSIAQNPALFSLLGNNYGGDGKTTFGLPDLRGRAAIGMQASNMIGRTYGAQTHTLSINEIPAHTHTIAAYSEVGDSTDPTNRLLANTNTDKEYLQSGSTAVNMNSQALGVTGSNQPIPLMKPYTVLNYVIALQGIFPSHN